MGYQDSGNRSCAFHSGNYIRCERYAGTLSRSFYVGDSISEEDIHANMKTVFMKFLPKKAPKAVEEKDGYIAIEG